MNEYVIAPAPQSAIPVVGGGLFPVRRVFCVGRNYYEPDAIIDAGLREPPFFFMKSADTILTHDRAMSYPCATESLHYEMEMVIAIGEESYELADGAGSSAVWGYTAGLDMTRRDLQDTARQKGRPWELGKTFEHAAPVGALLPAAQFRPAESTAITMHVNGELRQSSSLGRMIWNASELVVNLSRYVRLYPGDILFTGTPKGVGAVQRGDSLQGAIDGVGIVSTTIV